MFQTYTMQNKRIVIFFYIFLIASGPIVPVAATPPCQQDATVHKKLSGYGTSVEAKRTFFDSAGVTGHLEATSDGTGLPGSIAAIFGPSNPVNITTTEEVSQAPVIEENFLSSSILQATLHGTDGYLDIFAPSDQGPMTIKIASLGFPYDATRDAYGAVELIQETKLGSLVSLVPVEPLETFSAKPPLQSRNQTHTVFDARAVPLGISPIYNATDTGLALSADPITVRFKVSVSVPGSGAFQSFCVAYSGRSDQPAHDALMQLQQCVDTLEPDSPETQLWEYDPTTGEVRPQMSGTWANYETPAVATSSHMSPTDSATPSGVLAVETSPPTPTASSRAALTVHGGTSVSTEAAPSGPGVPARKVSRRAGDGRMENRRSRRELARPASDTRSQAMVTSLLRARPIVEPYSLVFTPKASVKRPPTKSPRPAA